MRIDGYKLSDPDIGSEHAIQAYNGSLTDLHAFADECSRRDKGEEFHSLAQFRDNCPFDRGACNREDCKVRIREVAVVQAAQYRIVRRIAIESTGIVVQIPADTPVTVGLRDAIKPGFQFSSEPPGADNKQSPHVAGHGS